MIKCSIEMMLRRRFRWQQPLSQQHHHVLMMMKKKKKEEDEVADAGESLERVHYSKDDEEIQLTDEEESQEDCQHGESELRCGARDGVQAEQGAGEMKQQQQQWVQQWEQQVEEDEEGVHAQLQRVLQADAKGGAEVTQALTMMMKTVMVVKRATELQAVQT